MEKDVTFVLPNRKLYPTDFLEHYQIERHINENEQGETLLVTREGLLYIAKCYYNPEKLSEVTESVILKRINHPGVPRFVKEYHNEEMLCVVREFVKGDPLNQWVRENIPTQKLVIDLAVQVCDILIHVHSLDPPVIHRDIKPQNLVIGLNGRVHLIDFGISRVQKEDAGNDTTVALSYDFAPPEQYGFAQTDCRTDLYALGVTIGYLLTNFTKLKKSLPLITNKRLRKIVERCTKLEPDMRYQDARALKMALLLFQQLHRDILMVMSGSFVTLLLCTGFFVVWLLNHPVQADTPPVSDIVSDSQLSDELVFTEALIEQAVRKQVGKEQGEALTANDLMTVSELYIFSNQSAKTQVEYTKVIKQLVESNRAVNGGIRSLEDLKQLPNLERIGIAMQEITDLSPLKQLTQLQNIDLKNNPIRDISPLADLPRLSDLSVYDTLIEDFSLLKNCAMLSIISAGKTPVQSLKAFEGLSSLTNLYLEETVLESISDIERFSKLKELKFTYLADQDLKPLLSLPFLQKLLLTEDFRKAAEEQLPGISFQIEYIEGGK